MPFLSDGGGFFLGCKDLGIMFDDYSPPASFFLSFFEVGFSSHTLIPLFGQDQSTVAQQAEMTVTKCSKLRRL